MQNLKWKTNKNLLYCTWNSAQYCVAVWMGGKFGGEWTHVYVWLSPFAVHLKPLQHCLLIGYTPIPNKKLKKKTQLHQCIILLTNDQLIFSAFKMILKIRILHVKRVLHHEEF